MCFTLLMCLVSKDNCTNVNDGLVANVDNSTTTTSPVNDIVWDGLSLDELTDKLNDNLYDSLKGYGEYFALYTKETGLDPYLAISIVNLETGCKWGCSKLVRECNNIGGIKGKPSCGSGSYKRYDSLEEGIKSYLDLIYYNYYLEGLDTAEKMNSKYAESSTWAEKVNRYYDEIVN